MAWDDNLNESGIANTPPTAQVPPIGVASSYSEGAIGAPLVQGTVVTSLKIGDATDPNFAVYIDSQGIYAGNAVASLAPVWIQLSGDIIANSLVITGYIPIGGAAADVNGNVTKIDGTQIVTGSITAASGVISSIDASVIDTGTLDASVVNVDNLTASNINTGTLDGVAVNVLNLNGNSSSTFAGNVLNGGTINITNLVANNITTGTLTGITIVGNTIETAPTGQRVTLTNSGSASFSSYDSTSTLIGIIFSAANTFIYSSSGDIAIESTSSTGTVFISSGSGGISLTGNVQVNGNFNVSGTKAFDIEHPTKKGKRLKYIAVESPEVLVMCRGIADTEEEIEYPQHFIDVTEEGSIQCQIGKLRGIDCISWIATGVRKGYANFEPEYETE